jgi:hypothetical protein
MSAELRFIGTNSQGRRADARRAIRQDVAGRDGGTDIAFRHMPADTEASSTRCAGMILEKIVNLHIGHPPEGVCLASSEDILRGD